MDGGALVLGLGSTEHLVDVLMGVPNKEEAQEDILKDVKRDQEGEESKHELVLVLSSTVVSLEIEDRGAHGLIIIAG